MSAMDSAGGPETSASLASLRRDRFIVAGADRRGGGNWRRQGRCAVWTLREMGGERKIWGKGQRSPACVLK